MILAWSAAVAVDVAKGELLLTVHGCHYKGPINL